jgi:hypothetical protein
MKPDATSLSNAVSAAIDAAKTKCPSDLKVSYLGIEGKFADSLFRTTIREQLTKLGVPKGDMRGRKRGSVASGGAQEDVGRAIEDIVNHNDWRAGATKAVFVLGDEFFEGGDTFDQADIDAANTAITAANAADTRVHTYLAKGDAKLQAANKGEFARVAAETGGQPYTYEDTLDGGFQAMLESVICASKAPQEVRYRELVRTAGLVRRAGAPGAHGSSIARSCAGGAAPTSRSASCPFLMTISSGMPWTP